MDRNIKAQIAFEFVLLVALGFMIFISLSATSKYKISELQTEEEYVLLKDIAYSLQNEVNIATRMQDGYYREFEIPDKLSNGKDYSINISSNYIMAVSENSEQFIEVPPITGNVVKNTNKINKTNGTIYLN